MHFRPCIDIHNGSVKQIVGGSLQDAQNQAVDNFVSDYDAAYYAELYKKDDYRGGHIILLNPVGSTYYEQDIAQAEAALRAYPGGMQIGGGITAENAHRFIDMGASHVIVTSYVFRDGQIDYDRLRKLSGQIGKEHLVLDLSCRNYEGTYYIVTDRWQKRTQKEFCQHTLEELAQYCDEFLVHAVDVEGKQSGIEKPVIQILAEADTRPVTYAGGIHSIQDLSYIKEHGQDRIDFTIGSALDLFGGSIPYQTMKQYC